MQGKDLLSITDLSSEEISVLLSDAIDIKREKRLSVLEGKTLAMVFEQPSLCSQVSFEVAMRQLGGQAIYLPRTEADPGQNQNARDIASILSRYVDVIAACACSHSRLVEMGQWADIPVINALDDVEQPCQALADLLTIQERKESLADLTVAYLGDGNNTANSLMLACALTGINFRIAAPPGYQVSEPILAVAREYATGSRAELLCTHKPLEAADGADVVYTDVWNSPGREAQAEERRKVFADYKVTESIMNLTKDGAIFMHPLPAHHGEEVDDAVFYSSSSAVFDQAENRLHVQKALLVEMLGGLDVFLRRHK